MFAAPNAFLGFARNLRSFCKLKTLLRNSDALVVRALWTSAVRCNIENSSEYIGASADVEVPDSGADKPNFQDKCDAYVSSSEIEARNTECKEIVEQVRLMNEYFNQYVEEYYEEFGEDDDIDVESLINKKLSKEEFIHKMEELREYRKALAPISKLSADKIVDFLRQQRVKNIVCLKMPSQHLNRSFMHEYVIICESHNTKHSAAVIQNITRFIKNNFRFPKNDNFPKRLKNGDSIDWFKFDLHHVALHFLTAKRRQHYALESLYAFDDEGLLNENLNDIRSGLKLDLNNEFLPPPLIRSKLY